jgi:hypothetical protein
MTLKEIREMFQPGQTWDVVNTYIEGGKMDGPRTVDQVLSAQIKWRRNDKPAWMPIPQASQIVEAREGFLSFRLFKPDQINPQQNSMHERAKTATVTLTRTAA